MNKKFEYHVDRANQVFSWRVSDNLSVEESMNIAEAVKKEILSMKKGEIKLLVDNSRMIKYGHAIVFKPDVNAVWEELQAWLLGYVSQVAVICNGALMKMQMDRLAKNTGLDKIYKPFWENNDYEAAKQKAYEFLGIKSNQLVA